jgi:hypothetical protein
MTSKMDIAFSIAVCILNLLESSKQKHRKNSIAEESAMTVNELTN